MKIKMKKQEIYIFIAIIVLAVAVALAFIIRVIKNKKTVDTNNYVETTEEISEESIENLEEFTMEEAVEEVILDNDNMKIEENKSSGSATPSYSSEKQYYIMVNYGANTVTIYSKDENGEYTIPYKSMVCSCGTATPKSGVYKIQGRWRWLSLIGGVHGQYATQIVGNILFHSVPYTAKSSDCLEYWEYDKLRNNCICRMC